MEWNIAWSPFGFIPGEGRGNDRSENGSPLGMAKVTWRRGALDDLDAIVAHIQQFDEIAALGIANRLIACAESLATFPRRGRPAANGLREMTIVPPYILRYDVVRDDVFITSIRHGARRPD